MDAVKAWLDLFAELVRTRNFSEAETLFDEEVFSFGSVVEVATDLETLRSQQWEKIWLTTRNFHFSEKPLRIRQSPDGLMSVVNALWTSESNHTPFIIRSGRATIVLQRPNSDSAWKATHSHFSLSPQNES